MAVDPAGSVRSGAVSGPGGAVQGVAEPVDHVDNAVYPVGVLHGDRDVAALFEFAGQGDNPVAYLDGPRCPILAAR